jgi:hypothetical protein
VGVAEEPESYHRVPYYATSIVGHTLIKEQPTRRNGTDFYRKPVLWTWIKKSAENNIERRKILSNVYGIHLFPLAGRKGKNDILKSCYEKRHAIVHGRDLIEMKLNEFCDVEILVTESVRWITRHCREELKLII